MNDRDLSDYKAPSLQGLAAESGIDLGDLSVFRLGLEMETFISQQPAAKYLVQQARDCLADAFQSLLDAPTLITEEARKAHIEAKAASLILSWIEQAIQSGAEAEAHIRSEESYGEEAQASE